MRRPAAFALALAPACVLAACRQDAAPAPSVAASAASARAAPTSPPTQIVAATGSPELLAADGVPLAKVGIAVVAGADVPWRHDGNTFVFDENGNGDLADDPPHAFANGELALVRVLHDEGGAYSVPLRLRTRGNDVLVQSATVRRGSFELDGARYDFALEGARGVYDDPSDLVGIDLDRDGKLDLDTLDSAEVFHVFEKRITIGRRAFELDIAHHGTQLVLHPLDEPLPPRPSLSVGATAPDFAIASIDGRETSLARLRGKTVLLDFWSANCAPCLRALPVLAELRKTVPDLEIVGIADRQGEVLPLLHEHPSAALEVLDLDESVQALYRVDRFPTYFLVAADGTFTCSRCSLDDVRRHLSAR